MRRVFRFTGMGFVARARAAVCAVAVFMAATGARAAGPATILPDRVGDWAASGKTVMTERPMGITEAQEALQEYGYVSGEEADYSRGAGAAFHVRVFQLKDPSGAYGWYSYLRTTDMPHADLAEHSAMSREHAVALSGNLVLDVRAATGSSSGELDLTKAVGDLKGLVATLDARSEKGPLPALVEHLPTDNIVERSDHYVLGWQTLNAFFPPPAGGDWIGFSSGAEVEVARYRVHGKDVTLLIADFPAPQSSKQKLAELKAKFNATEIAASGTTEAPAAGANATLYARRSVTLLAVVSGAASAADAEWLLRQVHSGTALTWNEPNFELTQPNIGTIVVGTIIGTGLICMFALISGLAFGGVRLVVKRLLPDKVFDRSSHLQVLQLGLSSKPIKSEDFYSLGTSSQE